VTSSPSPTLGRALTDVAAFSRLLLPAWQLRPYQTAPAQVIFDSVLARQGDQLALVFSRQSGKDELLAQVLAAILLRHSRRGGAIVVAAPTRRPQAQISRDRL
jgi:phage terminase large subunit-like protein